MSEAEIQSILDLPPDEAEEARLDAEAEDRDRSRQGCAARARA